MRSVSVAKAKEQLPGLLAAANAGETIVVTKHGRPIAEIVAPRSDDGRLTAADMGWLRAERVTASDNALDSAALIRALRDGAER
jgi:prevent-host-death family protein